MQINFTPEIFVNVYYINVQGGYLMQINVFRIFSVTEVINIRIHIPQNHTCNKTLP